jgi:hypothetical protein
MQARTLLVRAADGLKCPKQGSPRDYITDSALVEVPDTAHYRRLLADGSLTEAPPVKAPPAAEAGQKEA